VVWDYGHGPCLIIYEKNASFMSDRQIIPRQDAGIMDNGQVDVIR
jgi:hypothetical protein